MTKNYVSRSFLKLEKIQYLSSLPCMFPPNHSYSGWWTMIRKWKYMHLVRREKLVETSKRGRTSDRRKLGIKSTYPTHVDSTA